MQKVFVGTVYEAANMKKIKRRGQRKRRSDRGEFRRTPLDKYLLRWVGEQLAVRADLLYELAQRWLAANEPERAHIKTDTLRKETLDRWQRQGLVVKKKLQAHYPQWLWLTSSGYVKAELELKYRRASAFKLDHLHAVNNARLYYEWKHGTRLVWTAERFLSGDRLVQDKNHVADATIQLQGQLEATIGLEVERTLKALHRYPKILERLRNLYPHVLYLIDDPLYEQLVEIITGIVGDDPVFRFEKLSITQQRHA